MTGQQLVERWMAFVRRYVALTESQALVVALWAMNTWIYERFGAVPFLEIVATTKRAGKTTLLDTLKLLTRGSEKFAIVRILTILRMIEAYEGRVTILVDEAEQFSKASLGEQRSGVATGYKAGAQHAVSVGTKFVRFRTFAPWAFAQIGNVHSVLRDRCIEIELERGRPGRVLSEWAEVAASEAEELKAEYIQFNKRWDRVRITPADWLGGRERELWTPLVSLATMLGLHADTMRMLQAASVDFGLLKLQPAKVWHSAQDETDADAKDAAARVLTDMRNVFLPGETFAPSAIIVDRLRAIPTSPWRGWQVTGLDETMLAALLSRYGVAPAVGQVGRGRKGRTQLRGYRAADIARIRPE